MFGWFWINLTEAVTFQCVGRLFDVVSHVNWKQYPKGVEFDILIFKKNNFIIYTVNLL